MQSTQTALFDQLPRAKTYQEAFDIFVRYINNPTQKEFITRTRIYKTIVRQIERGWWNDEPNRITRILNCFHIDASTSTGKSEVCIMNALWFHINGDKSSKDRWLKQCEIHAMEMSDNINTSYRQYAEVRGEKYISILSKGGLVSPWVEGTIDTIKGVHNKDVQIDGLETLKNIRPLYAFLCKSNVMHFTDKSLPSGPPKWKINLLATLYYFTE